ncbi:LOW QUALITY PROTEIN: uncharacterized protein LOC143289986 [Babylonia areolata]|uniref:LOW QUALITY PROTEIN: uncharacterized protein LOC143289986 n=1 Tax=Babylonia areolata TaxID=304850 RepID=UPI003FD5013E
MAFTGISDDFDLDDHGILHDSFASDFHVDDDGILHDNLDLFKHAISTAGHGTDSGIGGDKQSSTSTLQHLHASFDDDLAPLGDESINISDFEASRDELDSFDHDLAGGRRSRSSRGGGGGDTAKDLETPGSTLERPLGFRSVGSSKVASGRGRGVGDHAAEDDQDLFTEDYYQQLRELGVLVDGADFSRDESQTEFEALESHLSREHVDFDDDNDNRDLIGEYLQNEYERERAEEEGEEEEEEEMDEKGGRSQSHVGPSSRANSAPTISERSFPEISPEDAEMMYGDSERADDEIYRINHQRRHSAVNGRQSPGIAGRRDDDRSDSRISQCQTPRGSDNRHWPARSRRSPSPGGGQGYMRSRSETNTPRKTRPDSAASHVSFASDMVQHLEEEPDPRSALPKARSEESFFEHDRQPGSKGVAADKAPKRMLPTPSAPDAGQSFRVKSKSKSLGNISGRAAPVKPTHPRSLSELSNNTSNTATDLSGGGNTTTEGMSTSHEGDTTHDRSEGELSTQLRQESSKRQQATELVQQLQKEYDSLLSKYALAELTIDQMRLGARVTLHADPPKPGSAQVVAAAPPAAGGGRKAMQLPTPSAQRAAVVGAGQFGGKSDAAALLSTNSQVQTSSSAPHPAAGREGGTPDGQHHAEGAGHQGAAAAAAEDRVAKVKTPRTAESVKMSIQTQAASLNDRLEQFQTLMENGQLTAEEQDKAFDNIRTHHEKLRRAYLQAKEDYNVLRRSGATPGEDFDQQKELEGQLFRLGMRFDEVQERVDSNLKQQTSQRQPFQTSRLAHDDDDDDDDDEVDGEDHSSEQNGRHFGTAATATNDDQAEEEAEYERRAGQLHEEYRALMDRYRRLKQMAPTPELEKERDSLVRKLNEICVEMPDMFRLPPELQDRWDRLQHRDQRRSPLPPGGGAEHGAVGGAVPGQRGAPPSSPKARGLPMVGDHSISPYLSRHPGGRDSNLNPDSSFRRTPNSLSGSRTSLTSPTAALRSSTSPSPQDGDRSLSPGSQDGAAAPRGDREAYDPRLARPRHHQHDFRDPKLSKMPERGGSYSSLPDSGISDQEMGRDRHRGGAPRDEALSRLPGPGTLKQLTHQRGDNDLDSGFMGSVVSASDGGGGALRSPARPHRLPETPLRLRDRHQNRPRLNSSDSTSTIGSQRQDNSSRRRGPPQGTEPQRLRPARPPPPVVPALVGIDRSMDRSYDAELDESTLSDTQASGLRGMGSKASTSQTDTTSIKRAAAGRRRKEEEVGGSTTQSQSLGTQSQSLRSAQLMRSRSMREDETLEDVSDGEMSDTPTTSHHMNPRGDNSNNNSNSVQRRPLSAQGPPASPRMPYRPPTPHQPPSPQRPPTPYRSEREEEEGEGWGRRAARPVEEQVLLNRSQQRRSRSPPAPAPLTPHGQRPQSRGAPTTDLFHTRPARDRGRDRSRDGESALLSARSGPRQGGPGSVRGKEELGVGSDADVRSDATRGSSINSGRLRALQDEIEKLKEGLKQAHEKASQQPAPPQPQPQPPPAPPPQQEGPPQYYDPFEDPYGFMNVPRRRANSFSGGRVREFDDWYWTRPGENRTDADADIPLGYAAADAYNRHHRHGDKTADPNQQRLRRGGGHRQRGGGEETVPKTVDSGGGVGNATGRVGVPTGVSGVLTRRSLQIHRPTTTDPQALYNYYLPSRRSSQPSAQPRRPLVVVPTLTANTPRRCPASQPNLAGTLAGVEPSPYPQGQTTAAMKRPWYTIRRAQWPAGAGSGSAQYYPTLGYQASSVAQPTSPTPAPTPQPPPQQQTVVFYPGQSGGGYRVESCPLCGGAGAHIHEDDVEPVQGYMAQDFATHPGLYSYREYRRHEPKGRSSRPRSRSASRSRHYTPERSSSHSRYLVREFGDSISDDSDLEPRGRRRSRSVPRARSHSETRSSSGRSSSRRRGRRYRRTSEAYDSDEDVDLNESLGLSEDINRLTRRMMGTVQGELRRHRDRKEFGSSYW